MRPDMAGSSQDSKALSDVWHWLPGPVASILEAMRARLHSLQVSLPVEVETAAGNLRTGLRKSAVQGPILLGPRALEGDGCGDLSCHGLEDQAVCVLPLEHYAFWREELRLDADAFPCGSFGDNFTVSGQAEADVHLGDRWRVGEAEVEVTKPRAPCSTLNKVWGHVTLAALMGRRGMTGWYLRVLRPGQVEAGQPMELLWRDADALSVAQAWDRKRKAARR